jgi:D-alanyl-D-alanine carboxypeptidase/D-alanyl-D-alanine-endopeptidase (penicillin-binding protein 4)
MMGIKEVKGDVIGDGTFFTDEMLESTWELEDFPNWYAACTTALSMNGNCLDFTVTPGEEPGDTANIEPWPTKTFVEIQNLVKTSATGSRASIDWWHYPAESNLRISGSIPVNGQAVNRRTTIFDGNLYGAHLLKERLEAHGIIVEGKAVGWTKSTGEEESDESEQLIFTHLSLPLSDIVAIINKPSQNFYADMLFRTLGGLVKNEGSFEAGGEAIVDFLTLAGAPELNKYKARDGSGLSRRNLIQPQQMTAMLNFATNQTWFDSFYASLPIAGVDGTLSGRMRNSHAENNVHAKTGTMTNVRGLSGYITTADGKRLIFSTFGNQYTVSNQDAGSLQDELCKLLAVFNYSEIDQPVATSENN